MTQVNYHYLPLQFVTQPDFSDGSQQLNQKFILFFSVKFIAKHRMKRKQANTSLFWRYKNVHVTNKELDLSDMF